MSGEPVMQPHCPRCLAEHWAPDVWRISHGGACPVCAHARVYTERAEYLNDLRRARARQRPN
jgi:hypothetical protein